MRKTGVHNWMLVLGVTGILFLTGCHFNLPEAAEAGMFDFVAGAVTDTLAQLLPVAEMTANLGG